MGLVIRVTSSASSTAGPVVVVIVLIAPRTASAGAFVFVLVAGLTATGAILVFIAANGSVVVVPTSPLGRAGSGFVVNPLGRRWRTRTFARTACTINRFAVGALDIDSDVGSADRKAGLAAGARIDFDRAARG